MVSVPPEVAANAAFQAAPSWLARPDALPANDIFRSLVHQNTQGDHPPLAVPLPPPPSQSAPPPALKAPANNSPAAHNNAPAPRTNAESSSTARRNDSSNTDANSGTTGATASSQSSGSTTQSTDTTSSSEAGKLPKQKPDDSQANADPTAADPTVLAGQQVDVLATTPTPVAISVAIPLTNNPAPPPSSGPSAPLAIAAAAIAASSQALAAPPATGVQVKSGPDASAASAVETATTKTIPSLQAGVAKVGIEFAVQANGADPSVVTTAALTGTVAGSVPLAPKAQGKTSATTPVAGSAATDSESVDSTTTPAGQNAGIAQALNTGKPGIPTAAVEVASGAAADAAAQTQPAAAHDHPAAANSSHASLDVPDPGAQAVASVQPQLNSASSLGQANNLTVSAATNGPVPISGVALQIAVNVKNGKSSFEIRLDPPELGRIDVRVQIDQNGQVTSHLTVEKAETLSMLQQDAPQLQQALNDAGLKSGSGGL